MGENKFLSELERRLRILPEEERKDALIYHEEYLNDAEEKKETAAIDLGSPKEVAAKIIAEYATSDKNKNKADGKRGLSVAWAVILAVFAAPIGLPLALAVVITGIALLIVLISLIAAFGATAFALLVAGIGSFLFGFIAVFRSFPLSLMIFGTSLLALGLGILSAKLTLFMTKTGFHKIARFAGSVILRRKGR